MKQSLCGAWVMRCEDGREWPAAVPGTVLKTLLDHQQIPDPFDQMNETIACQKMREIYTFERSFSVPAELLALPHVELVFEGLDTLAEVRLNGQTLAHTDNMHRTWRFDVKALLAEGENQLAVTFSPAQDYVEAAAQANPDITYTGGSDLLWTGSLRKAHYMFGWDWGPRLPDAGIWRSVYLEGYQCRVEDVLIHQEHHEGAVSLHISVQTAAPCARLTVLDPEGRIAAEAVATADAPVTLDIPDPRLWWPNGLGEQPLYTLQVEVTDGHAALDAREMRIGLRTMTVSTEKDEWGNEFAFCCNGVRFFAMGADYIPQDNLLTRVTREATRQLLADCVAAHFNCVRVWGGGIYPDEDFFDLCDEMGLVVWLDLMYACNIYRMSDNFRRSIVAEAQDNIRRVRHRASLGLICGNNEMEIAWLSWKEVSCHSGALKADYLEQFEDVLQTVCQQEAPDVFYWPSSPSSGGGFDEPNDENRGDIHDWSVWHGRQPFRSFEEKYPRFCSEFGFESFPCMDTLKTFAHGETDMNPFSQVMESHQKCNSGNSTMLFYLAQTLRYPFSMEQLVHSSQYLQAEAVRAGVEHWRRNRGRCMGAVYWQLNDCWPVASWASIDSLGRWKALHYAAARFYAPVMISIRRDTYGYCPVVSNEQRVPFNGRLLCTKRDAQGHILEEISVPVSCAALSSAEITRIPFDQPEDIPVFQCILLDAQGHMVSENQVLYTLPKHFPFRKPRIEAACDGKALSLTADTFCIGVALEAGDARFSDNWFPLYPSETRTVTSDRAVSAEELTIRWIE